MLQTAVEPSATLVGAVVAVIAIVGVLVYRYATNKPLADSEEVDIAVSIVQELLQGDRGSASTKASQFEQQIRDALREGGAFPSPETKKIDPTAVESILQEEIEKNNASPVPIEVILTDNVYYAPLNKSEMDKAKKYNIFQYLPYRPEVFDTDNFATAYSVVCAFLFGTNAVATVYDTDNDNYYNIIVYADATVQYFDPTTSEVVDPQENEAFNPDVAVVVL